MNDEGRSDTSAAVAARQGGSTGHDHRLRGTVAIAVVLTLALLGAIAADRFYYFRQRSAAIARALDELSDIRDGKIKAITDWRQRLLQTDRTVIDDVGAQSAIGGWLTRPGDPATEKAARTWLETVASVRELQSAILMDANSSQWIANKKASAPEAQDRSEAATARFATDIKLTDMFLDTKTGRPQVNVVVPVFLGSTSAVAVLVLHYEPTEPFTLLKWPANSPTSEAYLVRKQVDEVVYLNELLFEKGTALKKRAPLSLTDLPAARAVNGAKTAFEGSGYLGNPVLAAVGPVKDTPWYLVTQVDSAEVLAPVMASQDIARIVAALVGIAVALGVGITWRRRTSRESVRRRQPSADRYDLVTRHANDGVAAATANDEPGQGVVLEANSSSDVVGPYRFGDLVIDPMTRVVSVNSKRVELTRREFDILEALASHPGWVFSAEKLAATETRFYASPSSVNVHLARMRKKFAEVGRPDVLETVRGVGYRLRTGGGMAKPD